MTGVAGDVVSGIARQVRLHPTRPAIQDGDSVTTYAQLWAAAGGVAARLREAGAAPDAPVAVLAER
ncbi:MAG TPA: AMP-binding protein, partial [Rugosimonospora sp.]|nr:AMP-binding protein [Rugosimonospora sp.]